MSAGSHPIPSATGGVRRTPWAAGKPRHTGLTVIPRIVFEELKQLLEEQHCAGLLVAFCVLRLEAREVVALRVDASQVGRFFLAEDGEIFDLPETEAAALEEALRVVAKRGLDGPRLARWLYGQGRALQRRLSNLPWAAHIRVSVHLLHLVGDELAVEHFGNRPDQLRAYTRSRYTSCEDLRPRASERSVALYGEAMGEFFVTVKQRLEEGPR